MLRIAVVIPLYNKAQYIQAALDSVFAQSYAAVQVIVVDDGSTDESVEIVRRYKNVTIVQQANQGPAAARNLGVRLATADWIAFLDADDIWSSSHLHNLVSLGERFPDAQVLGSAYCFAYTQAPSNNDTMKLVSARLAHNEDGILLDYFAACCHYDLPLTASSVLIKRSELLAVKGFNPTMRTGEDQDLWSRLAVSCDIAVSSKSTLTYRIGQRNALGHHTVLEPAPQLATYQDLLAEPQYAVFHPSIRYLAHLTVLSCVKQRLQIGQQQAARTLLKTHWAVLHDRWYWAARLLSVFPTSLVKGVLSRA